MLATYRRESHHLSSYPQHHQPLQFTAQSPSTTVVPLYYPTNFSTVSESPSEASFSQQQYFDFVPTTTEVDSFDETLFDRVQLMTAGFDRFGAPPIRVQQSTPVPSSSSEGHSNQMIVEAGYPTQNWGGWDDSMGHLNQDGFQVLQRHLTKSHQRAPSTSSVGSAGPNSPYDASTSNPRIVPSDAGHDSPYDDARSYDGLADQAVSMTFQKPLPSATHDFLAPAFQNYNPSAHDSISNLEARMAMLQGIKEQQQMSGEATPAFTHSGRPSISSIGRKSPATPKTAYTDEFDGSNEFHNSIPTLDRTMSDICQDEMYNPAAFAAATPMHPGKTMIQRSMLSPTYRSVFTERIQAANNGHLSSQNASMGERSPFRQGSPFATFGSSPTRQMNTAAQLRENDKARSEESAFISHTSPNAMEDSPLTISPKDAILEYHESEEDANMPLFPHERSQHDNMSERSFATRRRQSSSAFSANSNIHGNNGFSFAPPSVAGGITLPQQYPFIAQNRRTSAVTNHLDSTPEFPAHLASMESSMSDAATPSSSDIQRPVSTQADTGTYTCTYHGCTLRFETPAKLQKHKRDSHRHSTPAVTSGATPENSGMTSAALLRNSQAGPHKCERINPSTGKPCNTIFSRPYDLTRHEDTIHNARKQKVRCQLCTEEKTFSRNDALTRHMRVVHPEIDFAGKSRRKHSH